MRHSGSVILSVGSVLALVVRAWASTNAIEDLLRGDGIVVKQQPTRAGGPAADALFRNRYNQVVWQQSADNVLLATATQVRCVKWWGFYGGSGTPPTPPSAIESMRIRVYSARSSDDMPGDICLEQTVQNPRREATGRTIFVEGDPAENAYQVDFTYPQPLQAQKHYWLEIAQLGDVDTAFRRETSVGSPTGFAYLNGSLSDWHSTSGDLAFQLSTLPEPTSMFSVLVALAGC